jgi:hypothetical protein
MKLKAPYFISGCLAYLFLFLSPLASQSIAISQGDAEPHASAILDIQSNTKGVLVPRLTGAQRTAITSPATGLLVFDIDSGDFWFYNGTVWTSLSSSDKIMDADGDTRVHTEESADEDKIRFDVGGTEAMVLGKNAEGSLCVDLPSTARTTIIGSEAGMQNVLSLGSDGTDNTFLGYASGRENTSGKNNTFLGIQSGRNTNTGDGNTAIGAKAFYSNTTGSQNTTLGYETLHLNTSGHYNTALGYRTMFNNISGQQNTGVGPQALFYNTSGSFNTAMGFWALFDNTSGLYNTAIGHSALRSNTTGDGNTASGYQALRNNTTANYNTATGYQSMHSNTTGSQNTASGYRAMYSNTIGHYNTASGYEAMYLNTSGNYNASYGYKALRANTSGSYNSAHGFESLLANTGGDSNTAFGYEALSHNTTQDLNTAVGYQAGAIETSTMSTFLGAQAFPMNSGFVHSVGIGAGARPTASHMVRIGNIGITSIGGAVNWTNFSDGRFKQYIQDDVAGLDFIKRLRPVTYTLDVHALAAALKEDYAQNEGFSEELIAEIERNRNEKASIRYSGFIAQEVEEAALTTGYDFSGVDAPKNSDDLYGLRYAEFVVPLVKAVQELAQQNEALRNENKQLFSNLASLKEDIRQLTIRISEVPVDARG